MRITDIKEQVKDSSRVSIFIDGKYAFSFSKNNLLRLKLGLGQELSKVEVDKLKQEAGTSKLIDLAYKWALRRQHSELEIQQYLSRRTQDEEEQKKVFAALRKQGFVDDEAFARIWYESRRKKGYSSYQIRGELFKKGIAKDLIDKTIDDEDEIESLKHLANKKARLSSYKDKEKLKAYLMRKGYRYTLVSQVLDELD